MNNEENKKAMCFKRYYHNNSLIILEDLELKEFLHLDARYLHRRIDFGVDFGIGYKLEGGLNFGARYNLGLTDINDEYEEGGTYKNGVFQISLGYFF